MRAPPRPNRRGLSAQVPVANGPLAAVVASRGGASRGGESRGGFGRTEPIGLASWTSRAAIVRYTRLPWAFGRLLTWIIAERLAESQTTTRARIKAGGAGGQGISTSPLHRRQSSCRPECRRGSRLKAGPDNEPGDRVSAIGRRIGWSAGQRGRY
jgi:hypothetical protein